MGDREEVISKKQYPAGEDISARPQSAETIEPETVDQLRARARNTIAERGKVLTTLLVDYDETEPAAVRDSLVSAIAENENLTEAEARKKLLPQSESLLTEQKSGTYVLLTISLPSDDIFVDQIVVPENEQLNTPAVQRYNQFVSTYGEINTVPQLTGERVPIEYISQNNRWRIAVPESEIKTASDTSVKTSAFLSITLYGVLGGLFALAAITALGAPKSPAFGAITPQTFVLTTLFALLVGALLSIARTTIGYYEQITTR